MVFIQPNYQLPATLLNIPPALFHRLRIIQTKNHMQTLVKQPHLFWPVLYPILATELLPYLFPDLLKLIIEALISYPIFNSLFEIRLNNILDLSPTLSLFIIDIDEPFIFYHIAAIQRWIFIISIVMVIPQP